MTLKLKVGTRAKTDAEEDEDEKAENLSRMFLILSDNVETLRIRILGS